MSVSEQWTVCLDGLEVFAHHGVYDAERELGQRFLVDVALELSECPGGTSDELGDTVDYAALADRVVQIVSGPPVALLERLASKIADAALEHDPRAAAVSVVVHKPHVAIAHQLSEARVELRRERS